MKRTGSGSGSGARSVSQRYGSKDPHPYQNVMNPEHWSVHIFMLAVKGDVKKHV